MHLWLFLLCAITAHASTVTPESVDDTLSAAVLVADIEVEDLRSMASSKFGVEFEAQVRMLQLKILRPDGGWLPQVNDRFTIRGPGGELGETGVFYTGFPKPYRRGVYQASLQRKGERIFAIMGGERGLVPLHESRAHSRNRTDGSNGEGNGPFLYWDPSFFPIPYYISAPTFTGRPDFVAAIHESFRTWRNVGDIRVEFLPMGCSQATKNENDGLNHVILVKTSWPFDSSAIAITRNFYVAGVGPRAGLILDSDILLNGVYHSFTTTAESGKHDIQNILTHEIGHFLGLGHEINPKDADATMFELASVNEIKKRQLHASDLSGIREAYAGVGQKIDFRPYPCAISDSSGNVGCAAIFPPRSTAPPNFAYWLALLALAGALCGLAKYLIMQRFK